MNSKNTNTAVISGVSKAFNGDRVVDSISFSVTPSEIFGLIGPNGAGKTTMIRMIMDIIKPDSGEISIMKEPISENTKNKIGYLPEERGFYKKLTVLQSLTYLASLKGINTRIARNKTEYLLQRVDMLPHAEKKIEELSRGMGQIVQFLTAIIHDPSLIILDEPFANLDPVNTELLKEIILEMRKQDKAIVLSTHRMNEVEELCDRILMLDNGRNVLYGELAEIKTRFRNNSVIVESDRELGEIKGIRGTQDYGKYVELLLDGKTTPRNILEQITNKGIGINRFEVSTPSLNEIFIQVAREEG